MGSRAWQRRLEPLAREQGASTCHKTAQSGTSHSRLDEVKCYGRRTRPLEARSDRAVLQPAAQAMHRAGGALFLAKACSTARELIVAEVEVALWRLWASVARSGACEPMRSRRFSLTSSGFYERTCDSSMTLPRALVPAGTSRLFVSGSESSRPDQGLARSSRLAHYGSCPSTRSRTAVLRCRACAHCALRRPTRRVA